MNHADWAEIESRIWYTRYVQSGRVSMLGVAHGILGQPDPTKYGDRDPDEDHGGLISRGMSYLSGYRYGFLKRIKFFGGKNPYYYSTLMSRADPIPLSYYKNDPKWRRSSDVVVFDPYVLEKLASGEKLAAVPANEREVVT
jgi:hypothetical protein